MRTPEQIAADLVTAQMAVNYHELLNTSGKTAAELSEMRAAYMLARQHLYELQKEERDFIERKAAP